MKALGLLGLMLALLVVGVLVKKQTGSLALPAGASAPSSSGTSAPAVRAQPLQAQEAFKQSLDAAMQQPRALPDEAR